MIACLALAGCGIFAPTRPETSGNVALTEVDGKLAVVQCVIPKLTIRSLSVSTSVDDPAGNDNRKIYTGNAESAGRDISAGEALSLAEPIEGLTTAEAGDSSIEALAFGATIYVSLSGDQDRVDENFEDIDPSVFVEGRYLYRNGRVGSDPCSDGK